MNWTLLLFCIAIVVTSCKAQSYPTVSTTFGAVRGYSDGEITKFLGIPYASPPIGNLRFTPPQPPTSWSQTRDALSLGNSCLQLRVLNNLKLGDEDCLYLNVYSPVINNVNNSTSSSTDLLPVMVWIYGGGYVFGDGYEFGLYDGQNLVKNYPIVLVTFNYRLGPFGFFAHPSLQNENQYKTTGNYGIQDQRYVLQWVQSNIANFGGDPNRVMIFGESAGAFSVCAHLVSPLSKGLFHAAIMESGTCDSEAFFQPLNKATSFNDVYANAIGCNSSILSNDEFLSCIRSISADDVLVPILDWINPNWPNAGNQPPNGYITPFAPFMPWGPAIDGSSVGLLDLPLNLIQQNQFTHVPLIIGTNQDEGDIFLAALPLIIRGASFPLSNESLPTIITHFYNASTTSQILDLYPAYAFSDADARMSRIIRDFFFVCATRRVARSISSTGVPVYMYHFTYKGDWIEDPLLGDYHSAELEYVFDNQWPPLVHIFSTRDQTMANTFGAFWTNHATYGNPNGMSGGIWSTYNATVEMNLIMDVPISLESDYVDAKCQFWDTVTPIYG